MLRTSLQLLSHLRVPKGIDTVQQPYYTRSRHAQGRYNANEVFSLPHPIIPRISCFEVMFNWP